MAVEANCTIIFPGLRAGPKEQNSALASSDLLGGRSYGTFRVFPFELILKEEVVK
jgi:hypothetical protein